MYIDFQKNVWSQTSEVSKTSEVSSRSQTLSASRSQTPFGNAFPQRSALHYFSTRFWFLVGSMTRSVMEGIPKRSLGTREKRILPKVNTTDFSQYSLLEHKNPFREYDQLLHLYLRQFDILLEIFQDF